MNANFRIGTKYILELVQTGEKNITPLEYLGFNSTDNAYIFKDILGYHRAMPRKTLGYYKVTYQSTK